MEVSRADEDSCFGLLEVEVELAECAVCNAEQMILLASPVCILGYF